MRWYRIHIWFLLCSSVGDSVKEKCIRDVVPLIVCSSLMQLGCMGITIFKIPLANLSTQIVTNIDCIRL